MITNYMILSATDKKALIAIVERWLKDGWDLGQFAVSDTARYTTYYQTVTKQRPSKRNYTGPR